MKKLLIAAVVLFVFGGSSARAATTLRQQIRVQVAISSTTPTEISGNTSSISTSANVAYIDVENESQTYSIRCSHSTTVLLAGGGSLIPAQPSGGVSWRSYAIGPQEPFFCLAAGPAVTATLGTYTP
jgi:hypothetical protein